MRDGMKSTEFWVGVVAVALAAVQQKLFPNNPFPQAEFTTVGLWIAARLGEKVLTDGDPAKRAWMTSQFWIAIAFAVAKQFIEIPDSIAVLVNTYIVGRSAASAAKDVSLASILGNQKTSQSTETEKP